MFVVFSHKHTLLELRYCLNNLLSTVWCSSPNTSEEATISHGHVRDSGLGGQNNQIWLDQTEHSFTEDGWARATSPWATGAPSPSGGATCPPPASGSWPGCWCAARARCAGRYSRWGPGLQHCRVDQSLMQDTLNESRDPDRGLDGDRLVHGCQNIIIEIELCHSLMT